MTTRTFRQLGIAFGTTPVTITAKVNGTVVFQGPVTTLDEAKPILPDLEYEITNPMFTWTADVAFAGPQVVEIQVDSDDADLIIAEIDANYSTLEPAPDSKTGAKTSSGPNEYVNLPSSVFGDVLHNGVTKIKNSVDELPGTWWWNIAGNDTLVKNINIEAGIE